MLNFFFKLTGQIQPNNSDPDGSESAKYWKYSSDINSLYWIGTKHSCRPRRRPKKRSVRKPKKTTSPRTRCGRPRRSRRTWRSGPRCSIKKRNLRRWPRRPLPHPLPVLVLQLLLRKVKIPVIIKILSRKISLLILVFFAQLASSVVDPDPNWIRI